MGYLFLQDQKLAGEIGNLGGNFSSHHSSVAVATKIVAAWNPVLICP